MTAAEPLTPAERNWLRANAILPPLFAVPIVVAMAMALVFVQRRFEHVVVNVFVGIAALLLIAVSVAVAMHVLANARDAREDAVLVRRKLLGKRSTGRSPRTFYAHFEQVGEVIVMGEAFDGLLVDRTYRVKYSRRTKRCWSATAV